MVSWLILVRTTCFKWLFCLVGADEEEAVDHHQDEDWEVQVQSLRLIIKEAFCESYIRFGEEHILVVPLLLQDLVSKDDSDSQS